LAVASINPEQRLGTRARGNSMLKVLGAE
jgi:hypothetical protein